MRTQHLEAAAAVIMDAGQVHVGKRNMMLRLQYVWNRIGIESYCSIYTLYTSDYRKKLNSTVKDARVAYTHLKVSMYVSKLV